MSAWDDDPDAVASGVTEVEPEPEVETPAEGVEPVVQDPEPEPENTVHAPLGATVEITVSEDAERVTVQRPDGGKVQVAAAGGRALYVLDQLGRYVMGGLPVTAYEVDQP